MLRGRGGFSIFMHCSECAAGARPSRHEGGGGDDGAETGSLSKRGQQQEMRATRRTKWGDGMERRAEGDLKVVVFNLSQVQHGPDAVSRTWSTHTQVQKKTTALLYAGLKSCSGEAQRSLVKTQLDLTETSSAYSCTHIYRAYVMAWVT